MFIWDSPLEELFKTHSENLILLTQLGEELTHRKSKRARTLMGQVSKRLAEAGNASATNLRDGIVNARMGSFAPQASQAELFSGEIGHLGPHPDDQKRPERLASIRRPGSAGLPDAWQRPLRTDLLSLPITEDTDVPDRYTLALNALISEIKRSGAGQKRYELEKGVLAESTGGTFIYAFPFADEAELFEDAQIELQVAGRRVEGSIVSISAGRLLIGVKDLLGHSIGIAVLLIDATALLEALVERIEQAKKGEIALNRDLSDSIVGCNPQLDPPIPIVASSIIAEQTPPLDTGQFRAYQQALSAAVTWIWGPPGCGKTTTLGAIVRTAFENERRVLVCSNTNKAVDQILYQICKAFRTDHTAMEEGQVVRLGRIVDDKLREYAQYVTLDGIVERLSKHLNTRKHQVEEEIERIDARNERAKGVLVSFNALDQAEGLVVDAQGAVNELAREGREAKTQLSHNDARMLQLETELRKREGAFLQFFRRSEASIREDIRATETARSRIATEIANARSAYEEARAQFDAAIGDRDQRRKELAREDRSKAEKQVEEAEEQRDALVSDLREIEAEIGAMRASILRNARVLGATCTKSYLSMKDIGQVDMVIIDEASMVLLPMAWLAAGLSRERVVICGDFRQIPPIVQSDQKAILDILAKDAFAANEISEDDPRLMMLSTQYRMDAAICDLISAPMYRSRLRTALSRDRPKHSPPPFDRPVTIIDTSDLWPFESQNAFFSRFNLMHALLARNVAWHLHREEEIKNNIDFGICTPYAAQAKLVQKLIEGEEFGGNVHVGTVHRYQGDERRTMLLEIPESHGGARNIGQFVQGLPPQDVGARLINVAISRAQDRFIVMANLTYLDKRLPSTSLLRSVLFKMQEEGRVVPGNEVLRLRPIKSDLSGLVGQLSFDEIAETLGIFDEQAFERALEHDIRSAKESVVIFSGYVTPSRVAKLGDLLRTKILEGVHVRCVTRPPQRNGSIPLDMGREALNMLEGIGVAVDCRWGIHQKVCLVDRRIVWLGSLNALSNAGRSDETMTRAVNEGYAKTVAAHNVET